MFTILTKLSEKLTKNEVRSDYEIYFEGTSF